MPQGESKTSVRQLAAVERQRQALELRKAGVDFASIARQVGYSGTSGAYKAVMTALRKMLEEPAAEVRRLELIRLDKLMMAHWNQAIGGDHKSTAIVLQIISKRCELLGLAAPPVTNINTAVQIVNWDALARELAGGAQELARVQEKLLTATPEPPPANGAID